MKAFVLILCILLSFPIWGQDDFEESFNKQYEINIKKEFINDVYIPATIEEAFDELTRLANPDAIAKFRKADEKEIETKLHFGLGRWMMVNWNFEDGSRLSHVIKEMGVTFPDDMCQFLIVSFHRHLNNKPLELEARANMYFERRKKEHEKRLAQNSHIIVKNN